MRSRRARAARKLLYLYGNLPYYGPMKSSIHARRKTAVPERKRARIELRVAASAKALISRAMAVSGMTAGDLAYEGARRVLEQHERMYLEGADRDAFLAAIAKPPSPSRRLVAALKRHDREVG
jgi:uncharacterized protein (DUF1778 family)